jgi:hypothetical protein
MERLREIFGHPIFLILFMVLAIDALNYVAHALLARAGSRLASFFPVNQ